ncbi:aldo-keto reductase 1B-like isoform X2 [Apostichopus japonicus]|uniref:aldo-keto reductase 1B-like isoform X2 n=1 Tax=Stichopus japonicus TaxID=307972 RepID=UPI003AB3D520
MSGCSAWGCSNRPENGSKLFRFPTNPHRRKTWEAKVNSFTGRRTPITNFAMVRSQLLDRKMTSVSNNIYATLCNGKQIPLLGLGTFQSTSDDVKEVIKTAVGIGYRHIDTARAYRNETEIGGAIKELIDTGVIKRTDIFVTTKLRGTFHRPENVEHALKLSLEALQLEYVDLYLMHSPMALEYRGDDAFWPTREDGTLAHDDIHFVETWKIENHPFLDQKELIDLCKSNDVMVTSYSPLGAPDRPTRKLGVNNIQMYE